MIDIYGAMIVAGRSNSKLPPSIERGVWMRAIMGGAVLALCLGALSPAQEHAEVGKRIAVFSAKMAISSTKSDSMGGARPEYRTIPVQ